MGTRSWRIDSGRGPSRFSLLRRELNQPKGGGLVHPPATICIIGDPRHSSCLQVLFKTYRGYRSLTRSLCTPTIREPKFSIPCGAFRKRSAQ